MGFGTTLVGILLSIVAALTRADLASRWSITISTPYRLINDYGPIQLSEVVASQLSETTREKIIPRPTPIPAPPGRIESMVVFGAIVLVFIVLVVALVLRDSIIK